MKGIISTHIYNATSLVLLLALAACGVSSFYADRPTSAEKPYPTKNFEAGESVITLKISAFSSDSTKPSVVKTLSAEQLEALLIDLLAQHGFTRSPELAKKLKVLLSNGVRAEKALKFSELTPALP